MYEHKIYGWIAEVQQSADGKWFSFTEATNEYSPAFIEKRNLLKWLKREGYNIS